MPDVRLRFGLCLTFATTIILMAGTAVPALGGPITMTLDTKDFGGNEVGRVIVLNGDDDNNNGVPDLNEHPVVGETNLRKLTIAWDVNGVAFFLKKGANGDKVKIWKDAEKNTEITFNGTDNKFVTAPQTVWVEGVAASAATDDVELFVNFTNRDDQKASVKLTVLWVDTWEFRVKKTEAWHADFRPDTDPRNQEVDPKDQKTGLHIYTDRLGQGIELRGHVSPSDFTQKITIIERAKQICEFQDKTNGSTFFRGNNFTTNNHLARLQPAGAEADSCQSCNQVDPQKSDPKGFIYDWDNSGDLNNKEKNTIDRTRKNFVQWPRFGAERAGVLAFWSQALSAKAATDPPQDTVVKYPLENSFQAKGDNKHLASGLSTVSFKTNLSFDLNTASCDEVKLGITTGALPGGKVGTSYSQTLQSAGGFPPVKWSVTAGALPDGLALDANSGTISGTPTKSANFTFTVKATDSQNPGGAQTATKSLSITVAAAMLKSQSPVAEERPAADFDEDAQLGLAVQTLLPRLRSPDAKIQSEAIHQLNGLSERKGEASLSFSDAELALLDGLQSDFASGNVANGRVAVRAIATLARIGSSKSVPLLVENLTFRDPDVTVFERGPLSYIDPEPKDLPVFSALLQLGDTAARALYNRALNDAEPLVQRSLGELLATEYGTNGGLAWLADASRGQSLTDQQRSRIPAIRAAIESKR